MWCIIVLCPLYVWDASGSLDHGEVDSHSPLSPPAPPRLHLFYKYLNTKIAYLPLQGPLPYNRVCLPYSPAIIFK